MANRYTQLTPSAYNPMSLNEIMLAPTLQRRQHDDTNAKIQEYLASLSSIDPHDQHWDVAQAEKQRLTEALDQNASQLAQKGFSPDITDNIMKFNRDYQESVSPTGKLGQIHAEKKNIQAQEDLFRQNYIQAGYSPDRIEEILKEEMENYRGKPIFDDKGRITSYKPRSLSKYVDHIEETDKYFSKAQISADDWARISSGLQMTADGRFEYVGTTTTERSWANNNKQLDAALGFLNRRLANPNDEMHRSLIDQGKTPQEAIQDINAMMGIYQKESTSRKDGYQMSNLMDPNAGKDKQEPVKGVTVTNAGTYGFTEDFETLSANTTKILEDPQASPVDKAKARDTQKLIQDIENELTDPNSPYYDSTYVQETVLENEILESFSTDNLREMFQTTISPHSFSKSVNQKDVPEGSIRLLYQMKDPKDGKQYDVTKVISNEEYEELQQTFSDNWKKINDVKKNISNKRNERLNQHAHEELRFAVPTDKPVERTIEAMDFFRGTTTNNLIPQHVNITKDNIPETLDLIDDDKLQLATILRRASNDEIRSILPTQLGRQVGFNVELSLNENNASAEIKKGFFKRNKNLAGELVNVFIPINASTEQITGYEESAMMNLNSLPDYFKESFKKMIDTRHISSTRNKEDLGQNAVPGRSILGNNIEDGGEIDFLENKSKNPNENYVSMYGRTDQYGDFRPMTWEAIIRYDILEDDSPNSQNYMRGIATSGIKETLKQSAKKYKSTNENQTLYDVFNLGSENADWEGLIRELRRREIRLPNTQSTYEITRLKALEQYE